MVWELAQYIICFPIPSSLKYVMGKNSIWQKTQKSLFLPYIWYEKAIFFVEKGQVSAWPRTFIWPN